MRGTQHGRSVGIGPSSSHTVGPKRAARIFVKRLDNDGLLPRVTRVRAERLGFLDATGHGHGGEKIWTFIGRHAGGVQWRILWVTQPKFIVGVSGLVRDAEGRVLLIKGRMWKPSRPWGLVTGYAESGERWEDTIVREAREETNYEVEVEPGPVRLVTGFKLRAEVTLSGPDLDVFEFGVEKARDRLADLGQTSLLPLERVFVAVAAATPEHGGFHHRLLPHRAPDDIQAPGYRYVRSAAVISRYGDLHTAPPTPCTPGIVGLDLLHAYIHDTFHEPTSKMIKRTMFGRANLDLLRQRPLIT